MFASCYRNAPPLPKNEAERILEVLEGLGRTPMGDAQRASMRVSSALILLHSHLLLTCPSTFSPPYTAQARPRATISFNPFPLRITIRRPPTRRILLFFPSQWRIRSLCSTESEGRKETVVD